MLKEPGIHFLCQFHPIIIVESKIDFLAVHCHMVPWGVYSIGPVAVNFNHEDPILHMNGRLS